MDDLRQLIRSSFGVHPNWPKEGVTFIDFLPIMRDPVKIDVVVGLDARGFLLGPVLALRLGAAFVPVRKRGKLPGECVSAEYAKEYGVDTFEMQRDAFPAGSSVLVVDDLIATGGSAAAAGNLVKQLGGVTAEYMFIIELGFLGGAKKLDAPTWALLQESD